MNKAENVNIKLGRYLGASYMDTINNIKPSLRKQSEKIIIHADMNDILDNVSYLANVKKIVKIVCETYNNTKFCFSSIISRTDFKDIDAMIKEVSRHFEN